MKKLLFLVLASLPILACKDKNKPQPEPEEYFSFYADGVFYNYPQEKKDGWLGESKTLFAGPSSATVGYIISARTFINPVADGAFTFIFSGNYIPTQDTIVLNGSSNNVEITKFQNSEDNWFNLIGGELVFSQRNANKLTGTFNFTIAKSNWGDTLHITNGKFSIIPSN